MKAENNLENEKILMEKNVSFNNSKFDVLLSITETRMIFQKKKGLFKKKYKVVKSIIIDDIKIVDDKVKIDQKKNKIIICTKDDEITFYANSMTEAKVIVEELYKNIFGENFLERTSKKGIHILNVVKNTAKIVGGVAIATVGAYKAIKDNKEVIKNAINFFKK